MARRKECCRCRFVAHRTVCNSCTRTIDIALCGKIERAGEIVDVIVVTTQENVTELSHHVTDADDHIPAEYFPG